MRRTLTYDQGREMARHKELTAKQMDAIADEINIRRPSREFQDGFAGRLWFPKATVDFHVKNAVAKLTKCRTRQRLEYGRPALAILSTG